MVAKTNIFTPDIVLSSQRVKAFLKGDKEILEIGRSAYAPQSGPQVFRNRWEITWIRVKSIFDEISALFLTALSSIYNCLGCSNLSKRCLILHHHQYHNMNKVTLFDNYGKDFLVSAINMHRQDTSDFYLQAPVSVKRVNDKVIKKAAGDNTVTFNHFRGVCRGMSEWFIYLYLKTRSLHKDPEEHLKAVAKIFDKGAPREAALLHSFYRGMEHFLGLKVDRDTLTSNGNVDIRELSPGIYNILSELHSWVYIKINDQLGYLWDPNIGLIRRDDSDIGQVAKIAKFLRKYEGPYLFNRVTDPLAKADETQFGTLLSAVG